MKKVSIVGIGMDGINTLTKQAKSVIASADMIIGAKRMTDSFSAKKKSVFNSHDSVEIAELIRRCEFESIAVLMSGDCGFYSGAQKLIPLICDIETEIIAAVSSPVYFCSRLKKSWQDAHFVSLHGAAAGIARNVAAHEKTFFLLGGALSAGDVCSRLCEYGLGNADVFIGENLSYKNERISCGRAKDFAGLKFEKLSVILVENSDYEKCVKIGIADTDFIRGNVPMTKSEVRSIVISRLNICRDSICWDIGSGTGSVSVEMAMQCPDGTVFSIEKKQEAIELTDKNSKKFMCDNINIIKGEAPEALNNLPSPACVFIGGSTEKSAR
ncbi:MAG: precorrin-6y C5,15-methyltransferase (decarboxylating) subunit CbiE [Oscillospiraceae bacterium]|jgi:precorrin-6Y C5,15-methyltransferase (decarboxylating)